MTRLFIPLITLFAALAIGCTGIFDDLDGLSMEADNQTPHRDAGTDDVEPTDADPGDATVPMDSNVDPGDSDSGDADLPGDADPVDTGGHDADEADADPPDVDLTLYPLVFSPHPDSTIPLGHSFSVTLALEGAPPEVVNENRIVTLTLEGGQFDDGETTREQALIYSEGRVQVSFDDLRILERAESLQLEATGPEMESAQSIQFAVDCGNEDFQYGSGTSDDPYRVCNANQLGLIPAGQNSIDSHYELIESFSMMDNNQPIEFEPIGDSEAPFHGHFDGAGHTISQLTITTPNIDEVGLFGMLGDDATVRDLTLELVSIRGRFRVGAIAGFSRGRIVDCSVTTGEIVGDESVGGLVGRVYGNLTGDATIENSHVLTVDVRDNDSSGSFVGGLAGWVRGSVTDVSSAATVTGDEIVGGLVGHWEVGNLSDAIATGSVSGRVTVGGLIGEVHSGNIFDCEATGDVTGRHEGIGGLIGRAGGGLSNCFATGGVSALVDSSSGFQTMYVGGLVGELTGSISSAYATGDVTAIRPGAEDTTWTIRVGGLVGDIQRESSINTSYATGDVSGGRHIGGLVGRNTAGTTQLSYAAGDITDGDICGGLIDFAANEFDGVQTIPAITQDSYATGTVDSQCDVAGGFAGRNVGILRRAYAIGVTDNSVDAFIGQSFGADTDIYDIYWLDTEATHSIEGERLSEAEFALQESFPNFEFDDSEDPGSVVWTISNDGETFERPLLNWSLQ